jgi:hypothetical protein
MPTVKVFAPQLSGTTGLALWLRKTSDQSLVNADGDALTETSTSGWFSADVAETWTERVSAAVIDADGLVPQSGWLGVGETIVADVLTGAVELDSATVTKIDNILTDTGTTLPAQISAISGGASLEDIIAGVQSVSGGIAAAQDESALYITIGDTWTQDVESLGNLTDKTVVFAIKSKARDADNAAVVLITEGTGLTRLNGAATTAGWGSIEILDEAAGDVRLRLESDATSLLTSGTYVDAIKALEDGDDRTLRQRGRTIVAAGVIADIT